MVVLVGTIAPNSLVGGGDADTITGQGGADTLRGAGGADLLDGGVGNDLIILNGGDVVAGERLLGGTGTDTLFADTSVNISTATQISGIEVLLLDSGAAVTLTAQQLASFAAIRAGGGFSWNLLASAPGTYDFRATSLGSTVGFLGSAGADSIIGGAGREAFRGGAGADTIDAGDGHDTVVLNGGDVVAGERLLGGEGTDTLHADSSVDISTATQVSGFEVLLLDSGAAVTLTSQQLASFSAVRASGGFDWNLLASAPGSYDFRATSLGAAVGFLGTAEGDSILGGAGREAFRGGGGADTIDAGDGDDTVVLNTADVVSGEILLGGDGTDTLFADSSVNLSTATLIAGFEILRLDAGVTVTLTAAQLSGFSQVVADGGFNWNLLASAPGTYDFRNTALGSTIGFVGSADADRIIGGVGNDAFRGGGGADTIDAGDGADVVVINAGDVVAGERLLGGTGYDTLFADSTTDISTASLISGFEVLLLDAGMVVTLKAAQLRSFRFVDAEGGFLWNLRASVAGAYDFRTTVLSDTVGFLGSTGADSIRGGTADEAFRGGAGADTIDGGAGDDLIALNGGDVVAGERLTGGAGTDTLFVDSSVDMATATLVSGFEVLLLDAGSTVTLTATQLRSFQTIDAEGGFNWNLLASAAGTYDFRTTTLSDTVGFLGSADADSIRGGAADEHFRGGAGADTIEGGAGDDVIVLNGGDVVAGERLIGGAGADTLFADSSIDISTATQVIGFETLLLDAGSTVTLTAGQLRGFKAIDAQGGLNWNLLASAPGTYDLRGTTLSNTVGFRGSADGDVILGGAGAEILNGGGGADTIHGGDGGDIMAGDAGDDLFLLVAGQVDGDRITDFTGAGAAGGDVLRFHNFGAGASFAHVGGSNYEVRVGGVAVESFILVTGGAIATAADAIFV